MFTKIDRLISVLFVSCPQDYALNYLLLSHLLLLFKIENFSYDKFVSNYSLRMGQFRLSFLHFSGWYCCVIATPYA